MQQEKKILNYKEAKIEFLEDIDKSVATQRTYDNALKQLASYFKEYKITKPEREHIINFKNYLKEKGNSPNTIRLYLVATRKFFTWILEKGYSRNFIANVKSPKIENHFIKKHLSSEQARSLLKTIKRNSPMGKRDYALVTLLLTTGIRTIEAARANLDDIRIQNGLYTLQIQGKGRESKDEYVKLPEEAKNALTAYLRTREPYQKNDPLFVSLSNRGATRLTTRSLSRIVKNRLKAAGLDDSLLSAHSLRHTAATINLLNGGTLEETQQLLRHKSINTTMRYNHALERDNNPSENRIANAIFN